MFAVNINNQQKEKIDFILSSVSKKSFWVQREDLLDVVTGLSGYNKVLTKLGLVEFINNA